MERGKAEGAVAGTRHSCGAFKLLSELCRYQSSHSRVVEQPVRLATDLEIVEQHGKLACDGDDCPSLSSLASPLSQLQSPSAQIGVLSEWAQDVLCPLYQHHAQIGISLPGDIQLRFALPEFPLPGCSPT